MLILQKIYGREFQTLYVYNNGRIVCECLAGLFNKEREVNSTCRHAKELREAIFIGDISKYNDVTPQ